MEADSRHATHEAVQLLLADPGSHAHGQGDTHSENKNGKRSALARAASPVAAGIGPSLLSYFWLGGDQYRSYDALLSLQVGYLFNVGSDERQRGWRGHGHSARPSRNLCMKAARNESSQGRKWLTRRAGGRYRHETGT